MSENPLHLSFSLDELESLFKSNYKSLCLLSFKIVNNKETAEDIVQDCFFKFWKGRESIVVKTSLKAYLYRSVTNASLNHLRLSKKHLDIDELAEEPAEEISENPQVIEYRAQKVQEAIEALPPKCKTIFILSRYQGLKYKEIADTLQISIKTVENQMSIAFEKLRDKLKEFSSISVLLLLLLQ
jgi:RNA polymerase sigma-70 factor (ECF subfamily)